MRNSLLCLLLALPLGIASPSAASVCPNGGCNFSPCVYTDLAVDGSFNNTQCSNGWTFVGVVSRYGAATCTTGLFSGYQAVFYGLPGQGAGGTVYQDIAVPNDANGAIEISFYVDIQGSGTNWDRLYVKLVDPVTGQTLENIGGITGTGTYDCMNVSRNVLGDYRGRTVRLVFESSIWTADVRFAVDSVSFFDYF